MEPSLSFFSDIRGTQKETLPITVHYFHLERHSQSAPRASQGSNVFKRGRDLVEVACSPSGWHYASKFPGTLKPCTAERSYTYFRPPPTAASTGRQKPVADLKEWGAPVDQNDDVFRLDELEDFISTDITNLCSIRPVDQNIAAGIIRGREAGDSIAESASKRQKLDSLLHLVAPQKLDSSLHSVIPQPHFLPTKLHPPPSNPPRLPPYTRAKPIPLSPSAVPFIPPPFSRSSWLIPIRGILPWNYCSSATILESPTALPTPADRKTTNQVAWTRPSVCAFWSFLLKLQTLGTLGSIGISFHAVPCIDLAGSYQQSVTAGVSLGGAQGYSEQRAQAPETPLESPGDVYRSPLSAIDHIKVYHEAPNAMYLRNALDVWAYEVPKDAVESDEDKPRKIRMLKGARLVLIDERSKGILVC